MKAAENGHIRAVQIILDHGGVIDFSQGKALQRAALNKHVNMVALLTEHGADLNSPSVFAEFTPLHLASQVGAYSVVDFLLNQPTLKVDQTCHSENCGTNNGWAAIHFAADNGYLDVVQRLVDSGATIDLPTASGDTAAAIAAEHGQFEVVRWLVTVGANIHAKRRGLNLVQWAIYRAESAMAQFLVSYGADPALNTNVLWFPKGMTLHNVIQRDFSQSIYEHVDTAIYRGGLLLRDRATHRRIISEVWWESKAPFDPLSFDPSPPAEILSFPPEVVHLISAYEM